ncbi:MAG: FmdB family zinc ribbon protein [Candidatus Kapaibacterium sp.]
MPTYEYHCTTCGKNFDVFQSMSSPALTACPEDMCAQDVKGRGSVVRKIGAGAGLIFNGSGFYLTDYKNAGAKSSASGSGTSTASTTPSTSSE